MGNYLDWRGGRPLRETGSSQTTVRHFVRRETDGEESVETMS